MYVRSSCETLDEGTVDLQFDQHVLPAWMPEFEHRLRSHLRTWIEHHDKSVTDLISQIGDVAQLLRNRFPESMERERPVNFEANSSPVLNNVLAPPVDADAEAHGCEKDCGDGSNDNTCNSNSATLCVSQEEDAGESLDRALDKIDDVLPKTDAAAQLNDDKKYCHDRVAGMYLVRQMDGDRFGSGLEEEDKVEKVVLPCSAVKDAQPSRSGDPLKPQPLRPVPPARSIALDISPPMVKVVNDTPPAIEDAGRDGAVFVSVHPNVGDNYEDVQFLEITGNVDIDECGEQDRQSETDCSRSFSWNDRSMFCARGTVAPSEQKSIAPRDTLESFPLIRPTSVTSGIESGEGNANHCRKGSVQSNDLTIDDVADFCEESHSRLCEHRESLRASRRRRTVRLKSPGHSSTQGREGGRKVREWLQSLEVMEENDYIRRAIASRPFDCVCGFVLLFNAVLMGVSTEWLITHENEALWMDVAEGFCSGFYIFEIGCRFYLSGRRYFTNRDRYWNLFDVFCAASSVADFFGSKVLALQGLRFLKMLRSVRIFRVLQLFHELAMFGTMFAGAFKILFWATIMVAVILYFFAIWFTQATVTLQATSTTVKADATAMFGSLSASCLSLIEATLDGRSWSVFVDVLRHYDPFVPPVFWIYIVFMRLAILNVITGVFVDQAVAAAQADRELVVMQELGATERSRGELRELFKMIDRDGSESVTIDELELFFLDERIRAYFSALGVRVDDMKLLLSILDIDNSGKVDCDEFVEGCSRMKGLALRVDMASILRSLRQLQNSIDKVSCQCKVERR
eukprot:TRINITY_DN12276_c0_g2_i1.p1 TRINITY_DN12276_c0_g2~~TRINITY_DN12276_c0_g2_i1.p1  ORF type:complete len:799 (-),score=120.18 TRINITY_DN12276_c0_g2_i1:27-2423(-)